LLFAIKTTNQKIEGRIFPSPKARALVAKWLIRHCLEPRI